MEDKQYFTSPEIKLYRMRSKGVEFSAAGHPKTGQKDVLRMYSSFAKRFNLDSAAQVTTRPHKTGLSHSRRNAKY
jgi:hypothetical protein